MLGGVGSAPVDERATELAGWAVGQLNSKANVPKTGELALLKVVEAKKQVVAGIKHILKLEAKDATGKVTTFEVSVWEKPAYAQPSNEAPLELTDYKIVGSPVAEANEEWHTAAQQLVAQLNQRSNSLFPYVLKDVLLANPANDGEHVDLRVAVTRGDKHETISIKAHKKGEAHYGLVEFHVTPEST